MNYETVERCGRIYVVKNGVESGSFVIRSRGGGCWLICQPDLYDQTTSLTKALAIIAINMDAWHTVPEAAARLIELGKTDKPPATQTMYRWLRTGRFPGALKVDAVGRGGSWRIPETALREFRKGGEE